MFGISLSCPEIVSELRNHSYKNLHNSEGMCTKGAVQNVTS